MDNGGDCPHHHADVHGAGGVVQEGDVQEGGACADLRREVWRNTCIVQPVLYLYLIINSLSTKI